VCECVCVCVCKRERKGRKKMGEDKKSFFSCFWGKKLILFKVLLIDSLKAKSRLISEHWKTDLNLEAFSKQYLNIHIHIYITLNTWNETAKQRHNDNATWRSKVPIMVQSTHNIKSQYWIFVSLSWYLVRVILLWNGSFISLTDTGACIVYQGFGQAEQDWRLKFWLEPIFCYNPNNLRNKRLKVWPKKITLLR
jgi:hypothetical protein